MAYLADYTAGTASVAADGTVVTGVGTGWKAAQFREGDWFIANGYQGIVASVDSNTQVTLDQVWQGGALTGAPYRLRYMSDGSRSSAQARELIDLLSKHAFFEYDASGPLVERAQYDAMPQGFSFLDTSTDPMELYIKASDASGDWAGPTAWGTGPQGPAGPAATINVGTTTTLAPATPATVNNSGTTSAAVFNFGIPKGDKGDAGWAMDIALVPDGASRTVMQVDDFIGGEGTKPPGIGMYIGPSGLVNTAAEAINVKGNEGAQGPVGVGWQGQWDSATDYNPNDLVVDVDINDDPAIFIALTANTNVKPRTSATDWQFFPGSFATAGDYGLIIDAATSSKDYGTIV